MAHSLPSILNLNYRSMLPSQTPFQDQAVRRLIEISKQALHIDQSPHSVDISFNRSDPANSISLVSYAKRPEGDQFRGCVQFIKQEGVWSVMGPALDTTDLLQTVCEQALSTQSVAASALGVLVPPPLQPSPTVQQRLQNAFAPLQGKIKECEEYIKTLKKELSEAKSNPTINSQQLDRLENEKKRLQEQLHQWETAFTALDISNEFEDQDEIHTNAPEDIAKRIETLLKQLHSQVKKESAKTVKAEKERFDLDQEKNALFAKLDLVQQELEEYRQSPSSSEILEKLAQKESEIESLKIALQQKEEGPQKGLQELQNKIGALQEEVTELTQTVSSQDSTIEKLERTSAKREREFKQLQKAYNKDKEELINRCSLNIDSLQHENKTLTATIRRLQADILSSNRTIQTQEEVIELKTNQYRLLEHQHKTLSLKEAKLLQEYHTLHAQHNTLKEKLAEIGTELDQTQAINKRLMQKEDRSFDSIATTEELPSDGSIADEDEDYSTMGAPRLIQTSKGEKMGFIVYREIAEEQPDGRITVTCPLFNLADLPHGESGRFALADHNLQVLPYELQISNESMPTRLSSDRFLLSQALMQLEPSEDLDSEIVFTLPLLEEGDRLTLERAFIVSLEMRFQDIPNLKVILTSSKCNIEIINPES
jgi:hypothetical protein